MYLLFFPVLILFIQVFERCTPAVLLGVPHTSGYVLRNHFRHTCGGWGVGGGQAWLLAWKKGAYLRYYLKPTPLFPNLFRGFEFYHCVHQINTRFFRHLSWLILFGSKKRIQSSLGLLLEWEAERRNQLLQKVFSGRSDVT